MSEEKFKKLNNSRDARQTLGGDYLQREQVKGIPEILDPEKHAAHCKCYHKFTQAVSVLKGKNLASNVPEKRPRRSGEFSHTLFPEYCMKCKSSNTITVKDKKQFLKTLTTAQACETVKLAAKLQKDEELLSAIVKEDLIAKEFKMHVKCTKKYHHWKVVQLKKNKIQ